jgi:2-polyprenyl-3-methyl-5-hydroxy-6-metoxy-1,4-benzoquinol methylase
MNSRRCAICRSACRPCLTGLYDDRYGFPGRFDLQECGECGHRQLDAHFTDGDLVKLYSEHYPRRASTAADFAPHRETTGLRAWLNGDRSGAYRWVPPKVRVLDIGSGSGRSLAYHAARGCDAWGVEADESARQVAERHRLNVRIGVFDAAMFEPGSFDYATMDQVIEHAVDPVRLLCGAASLVRAGGYVVLSTPNSRGVGARLFGKRWINWHAPYHLHQFSHDSLRLMASAARLEIASLRTLTYSVWLHYQWMHLATFPPPGSVSAFWDPSRSKGSVPRGPQRAAALAHDLWLDHLVTRAADAVGMGDNFLCVLRKAS